MGMVACVSTPEETVVFPVVMKNTAGGACV
jgi:hypothetical protein